jgi:nucleoside 2-deoxyribosyltransferase
MPQPPLSSWAEIATASADDLKEQLRWEFELVFDRGGFTSNDEMAGALSFAQASSISKWRSGYAVVSQGCAEKLDAMELKPEIGGSFVELRKAYTRASRRKPGSYVKRPLRYHVFLASPMASAKGSEEYRLERRSAQEIKRVLETWCDFSVYYAGQDLESEEDFETPEIAAEVNFEALDSAKFFVLLVQTPLDRPSSVHVEAGYALAKGIPSLYIVPSHDALPFVLQKLGEQRRDGLPPVTIQYSTAEEAARLLKRHGTDVFERLEWLSREGPKPKRASGKAR